MPDLKRDPILAAIEKHRTAVLAYGAALTKDEDKDRKASRAMDNAAETIINLEPKTLKGAIAVLQYAVDHMDRYHGEMMGWPDAFLKDGKDGDDRSSEYFLMQNVARCLSRLSGDVR